MISVAITQRVSSESSYTERRDALDQRWVRLFLALGFWPVVVPNNPRFAAALFDQHALGGLLLTGGDSLVTYGGTTPERDEVETLLLQEAVVRGIPVVGVCRGMQLIQQHFGVRLEPVAGHVRTRHQLKVNALSRYRQRMGELDTVNAYHNLGAFASVPDLLVGATSPDGVVMAVEHPDRAIFGQMWHSEREEPFVPAEIALLTQAFQT